MRSWTTIALLLLAACAGTTTSNTQLAPTSTAASTPTSTTTTTAAPPETWSLRAELDPVEALTLGPGVRLTVSWPGGEAQFDETTTVLDLDGDGPMPDVVRLAYPEPHRGDDTVSWTQPIAPEAESLVVRQPWRAATATSDGSILLAWQAFNSTSAYVGQLDAAPGLTVTSPIWWTLSSDGDLIDEADARLVAAAERRGIDVWPAIASLDVDEIHLALGEPDRRSALASTLVDRAIALGVGGINLDLEGFAVADAPAVTAFAEEIGDLLHDAGLLLSIDLTTRSDTWAITPDELDFWSIAPQRRELSAAADYVILMAYDQFNSHRPAGPVASPEWVEEVLRYQLRYSDPASLILGVPFYFRVWDPDQLDRPRAIGVRSLDRYLDGVRTTDPLHGLDRIDRANGTYLWVEDPAGLVHRQELVAELGLAGLAAWRLGFDGPEVWDVLAPDDSPE